MALVQGAGRKLSELSVRRHGLLAVASFVLLGIVNVVLDASYAASNHPVAYAEGQTTFSGSEIKGFYAVMEEAGTLGRYWQTQLIDFGFIAMMIAVGLTLGHLFARLNRPGSVSARLGLAAALLIPLGAVFDIIENLISFILLLDPQGFPDWLAIPYSAAAVIKFVLIGLGVLALLGSLLGWILGAIVARFVGRASASAG